MEPPPPPSKDPGLFFNYITEQYGIIKTTPEMKMLVYHNNSLSI